MLRYRDDIDGLRAFAVLGVLMFHIDPGLVPGGYVGVDVFFVISGYLISRQLLDEYQRNGGIDFVDFWSRRFRRLLPAAAFVIVTTLLWLWAAGTPSQCRGAGTDALFATLYLSNWHSLYTAVEYFGNGAHGYFVHFWSLGVEEQFYVACCVFALAGPPLAQVFLQRVRAQRARLLIGTALVVAVSFILCVWTSAESQPLGFFATYNRAWQFGVGVLVMLGSTLRVRWAGGIATLGVAGLTLAYALLGPRAGYPGWQAFVPTVAAGFTILAGGRPNWVSGVLGRPLLRALGKCSYSMYLWHWVVVLEIRRLAWPTWLAASTSLAIVLALSLASYHWVEQPFRTRDWFKRTRWRPLGVSFLCVAAVVATCAWFESFARSRTTHVTLPSGVDVPVSDIERDLPLPYRVSPPCHVGISARKSPKCQFGQATSSKSIVLLGDSHAAFWFPALNSAARRRNVSLITRTKSSCPPMPIRHFLRRHQRVYRECDEWRENTLAEIRALRPDLIVVSAWSRYGEHDETGQKLASTSARAQVRTEAINELLLELSPHTHKIVLVEDVPAFAFEPVSCLLDEEDPNDCRAPTARATEERFPWQPPLPSNASVVSFNDLFCDAVFCRPFTDTLVTHWDRAHLSRQYVDSISDIVDQRIFGD